MCSDLAISVKNLSKTYRVFGHPGDRIKQAATFGKIKFHREFCALQDVSLDIRKGECVGIIGRNGSGKSTLLQLVCGVLKPTSGFVSINGRISALLELGAGFNPEFTGRENIYFQGALMGFTKTQMDERFEDIATFADIGEFIDQPVRTYSSGMFVRLGFAVAIHVAPEILIVDEALGVGDAAFRFKCLQRIDTLKQSGCTILMVSHNVLDLKRVCTRGVVLHAGNVVADDKIDEAINRYEAFLNAEVYDAHDQIIKDACFLNSAGTQSSNFLHGEDIIFRFTIDSKAEWGDQLRLICNLVSPTNGCVSSFTTSIKNGSSIQHVELLLKNSPILRGAYMINTTLLGGDNSIIEIRRDRDAFTINTKSYEETHWSIISTAFIGISSEWRELNENRSMAKKTDQNNIS